MAKIVLKEKEYILRLDFNAICSFEKATGKGFLQFANSLVKNGPTSMQMTEARALIWAGLLHQNKDLKIDDIGNLIEFDNISEVMTGIANAIIEAMPKLKEETDKKKEQI